MILFSFWRRPLPLLGLLILVPVAPAPCQSSGPAEDAARLQPPGANEASPSSPEMQKGPAVAVENEADPGALAINLEVDTRSRYVFRGLASSEGAVVQPTLSLAKRGITFSVFGNLNASRTSGPLNSSLQGPRQINEIDYILAKSLTRGKTILVPGFVYYQYPTGTADSTGEISLGLSRSVGKAKLFFNNNLDVLQYDGAYFGEIGVSHEHALNRRAIGEATLSVGFANGKYNEANSGLRQNALDVLSVGASLTFQISEKLYLRPHLNYTRILDSGLRDQISEPSILEGSVAVGFDF